MVNFPQYSIHLLTVLGFSVVSGCQLVKLKENELSTSLNNKTINILSSQKLSETSRQLLSLQALSLKKCNQDIDQCVKTLYSDDTLDKEQVYSTSSELYMAKALELNDNPTCKSDLPRKPTASMLQSQEFNCRNLQLNYLDKSLRYSYVYLFFSAKSPESRVFDSRQAQVRNLYNAALSLLVRKSYERDRYSVIPQHITLGYSDYQIDLQHFTSLKDAKIEELQSSYNMDFSGLDRINRQEGIGSEFVVVKSNNHLENSNPFILDPEAYYKDKVNPNIRDPRYLALSTVATTLDPNAKIEDILSGKAKFGLQFIDPNQYKTTQIYGHDYTLTANYSVSFGLWLAENKLGSAGYWTLFNRDKRLGMPYLFKLERYQPNKKIILMIHGLASSPETWISLTNNIMGDPKLRDNYQVWQIFYSTNMPIIESRFQINALLKQAFLDVDANSPSAKDTLIIGHSMGGIISRLLVSDADISAQAIPLMSYEQNLQLQRNPIIRERFIFKPLPSISRAIFIAAPHQGSELADKWYADLVKKLVKLPNTFFEQVDIRIKDLKGTKGIINSGPDDLVPSSNFMKQTHQIMPVAGVKFHSIIGNNTTSNVFAKMTDGIVPYSSSHLAGAQSEIVIRGGHSIHEKPETLIELRRILHEHLKLN